jgi:hypothetical protein
VSLLTVHGFSADEPHIYDGQGSLDAMILLEIQVVIAFLESPAVIQVRDDQLKFFEKI